MQMNPIKSSNISAAGYQDNILRVQFSNGTQYDYSGVSAEVFGDFMSAKSQGKYFNTKIRTKYNAKKVTEEDNNAQRN